MIALRERNFRLYWFGQAVSNTGNWMQVVALGWFILQLNGSPIALGWLGLAQFLPIAGLSLVGGVLADHFPRRSLLLVTQSMAMLLACMLALLAWSGSGKPPLWSLLLIAALASTVTSIDNPARQAFLGDLVGKEAILNAVALNAGVYNGAAVIGPSLAGLLLLHVGVAGCFALNAVSFLAVIIALLSIVPGRQSHALMGYKEDDISLVSSTQRPSPIRAFWNLRRERIIMAVLAIAAIVSLLGRPYLLLLPAFAKTVQHVGPQGLGLMTAASGLGSLLGALFLAALKSSKRLERLLLICGVGFGLMLLLFALTPTLLLALFVLAGCGMGATMSMMVANTMLQTQAPAGMRGRVMSLYTLIAAGFTQAGVLILSGLSILIHLSGATVIAGIAVALAAMLGVRSIARNRSSGGKA
ncbi:MAG TPA: MFS transporter [Ktedonobacteraceae bacterium]|nr:MFS transporter [Ktedonobacteraceae bacterium]